MPGSTTLGIRYPLSTEPPAGHSDMQRLAGDVDGLMSRGVAGPVGAYKKVTRAAAQSIPHNTPTPIIWDATPQPGSLPCTISGSRLTVAQAGLYDALGTLTFNGTSGSTGAYGVDIGVNGGRYHGWIRSPVAGGVSAAPQMIVSMFAIVANANDYFELMAIQTTGASLNTYAASYANLIVRRVG